MILKTRFRRFLLRKKLRRGPNRIIIGAGPISIEGWTSTDKDVLNILRREDWSDYFEPNSIEALLSEHTWEHLTIEDGLLAAINCHEFLKVGARFRIGVPDGYHPDPAYIDHVRPEGTGPGADDHKILYNQESFSSLFQKAGFKVHLLEYWDLQKQFHAADWDPQHGMIHRSKRFDPRNQGESLVYTSLILDAVKP